MGEPDDKFEREADLMAEKVMAMPKPPPPIQRKCDECEEEELQMKPLTDSITPVIQLQPIEEEEEMLQMQPMEEEEEMLQPKLIQKQPMEEEEELLQPKLESSGLNTTKVLQSELSLSKGRGSKMPEQIQSEMSNSFGADFNDVRIHTDQAATEMNRSINAKAFTHGQDIYFNNGEFKPESNAGKHLLAHELTHVVQQNPSPPLIGNQIQRTPEEESSGDIIADLAGPVRTFEQLLEEFDYARRLLGSDDAIPLVRPLLNRMFGQDSIAHALDIAYWLRMHGETELMDEALDNFETAVMLEATGERLNEAAEIRRDFQQVDEIIQRGRDALTAGNRDEGWHLFGIAFTILQVQLMQHSERRFESFGDIAEGQQYEERGRHSQMEAAMGLGRVLSYLNTTDILDRMRSIITYYGQLERQALLAGNTSQAEQHRADQSAFSDHLRTRYLIHGEAEGTMALVLEASRNPMGSREDYSIRGAEGGTESLSRIAGEPHPDDLGQHPGYTESMEGVFDVISGQEGLINDLLQFQGIRTAFSDGNIDLVDRDVRARVWNILFAEFQSQPLDGCSTALCSLIRYVERYLGSFTMHTSYSIRDYGQNYMTTDFPQDALGRTVADCGVYALTVAYDIYMATRNTTPNYPVSFQIYFTTDHAMLTIEDTDNDEHFVVNNNRILGPHTGEPMETIALAYSQVMGVSNLLAAGSRTPEIDNTLGPAAFRRAMWAQYSSTSLGIETPAAEPGDTSTYEERTEAIHTEYYETIREYDEFATRLQGALNALVRRLNRADANPGQIMSGAIGNITSLGQHLLHLYVQFIPPADPTVRNWGNRIGLTRPTSISVERLLLHTGGTQDSPIIRIARALLFHRAQGATLTPEQQQIIDFVGVHPSFGPGLQAYESAGTPPNF